MTDPGKYRELLGKSGPGVRLVAVSKTKPAADILELYQLGQRDFGENYVQELVEKQQQLPADIRWHFLGHLQSNKVKFIAPFIHLIHGVDSLKLLKEIDKQALRNDRTIDCLLQVHIAREETKFGFDGQDLEKMFHEDKKEWEGLKNIRIRGLMGMASFTEDTGKIRSEFRGLKSLFDLYFPAALSPAPLSPQTSASAPPDPQAPILSMGMSGDFTIAIDEGSNMIRIGSLLFGSR
jgi:pyridoxal phosphate enzyme (YggS family)